jgi:UDP-glucose 4-epimerase
VSDLIGIRVLVTGGAGFIGSELVRELARRGADVTVLDNLVNGKREHLSGLDDRKVRLVVGDIRDEARMRDLLRGVALVFHLACLGVRHSIHSPYETHEVNASGTLKVLKLAREAQVARFVYVSSSEIYGSARLVPMAETHPAFPTTVYGASKLAGECYTRAFFKTYGFPTVIVRPFNTYGPRCHHEGDSGEVIPKFMLRCMAGKPVVIFGDGTQTRDFSYVSDIARGILLAGLCDKAVGQTINLGTGKQITISELAQEVAIVVGLSSVSIRYESPRPGDTLRLCADISLARSMLGFQPRIALDEGLVRLRDWYLSLGQSPAELLALEKVRNWEV